MSLGSQEVRDIDEQLLWASGGGETAQVGG
jgi:hypothetical protein